LAPRLAVHGLERRAVAARPFGARLGRVHGHRCGGHTSKSTRDDMKGHKQEHTKRAKFEMEEGVIEKF
jgi:hypothetical protein